MRKITLTLALAFFTITCFSYNNPSKPNTDNSIDGGSLLGGTKTYTLDLANAMPAEDYTFRPSDSIRSFGEQLAHIALSTQFLMDVFLDGKSMPTPEEFGAAAKMEKEIGADKEKCIAMLKQSMDALDAKYASMTKEEMNETFKVPFDPNSPELPKSKAFDFITDHITHHRAQALVALRMQGIPAPAYRLY